MDTTKIIKGIVNGRNYTVTSPIVKEDYGLYLKIEGVELPPTYQVDFSNSENNGTSVTMIGNSDGVLIPHQFISTGKDVFAFLYWVGADYGKTVYKFRIPNKVRPDRTDDEPTPEEQSVIDQTISALNDAVESTQEAQEAIENMSVSAQTLAEGSSATVTKTEQEGVVHLEFGIPKGATGDSPTITASKTGKATSIYVDGSEVAQIEDGTDGINGIDGISPSVSVTDITGGHRVVITDKDGEKSFDVEDGATGATPNLTIGTVETLEPAESVMASITGTPENPVLNLGIPQGEQGEVTLEEFYKAFPTDTASGAIASFTDGADDLPLKSLVVSIEPKQDGTGDPSPDNVRPISGWTGAKVARTGKNIFDESAYTPTNMTFVINGSEVTKNGIRLDLPSGTYTFGCNGETVESYIYVYSFSADGTNLSRYFLSTSNAGGWLAKTITIDDGDYLILCRATSGTLPLASIDLQIELGSTATAYEPYKGQTIPISWQSEAGTVYGGKLDVLSGVLRVDHVGCDLSQATEGWIAYNNARGYYINTQTWLSTPMLSGSWYSDPNTLCDSYPKVNRWADDGVRIGNENVSIYFVGVAEKYPTVDDWISYVRTNGIFVVYPIQPIEIQLTPQQVNSLLGVNNIWADTGDTEVEYRADTKLYISKKIAEAISALS